MFGISYSIFYLVPYTHAVIATVRKKRSGVDKVMLVFPFGKCIPKEQAVPAFATRSK